MNNEEHDKSKNLENLNAELYDEEYLDSQLDKVPKLVEGHSYVIELDLILNISL